MHPHVLLRFRRVSVLQRWKETPASQRLDQNLIQTRIRRGLHEFDGDRAIGMNHQVRDRNRPVRLLAQVVGNGGQWL